MLMKAKQVLLFSAAILYESVSYSAENTPLGGNITYFSQLTNIVWGAATNGVRAGVQIILPSNGYGYSYQYAPKCNVFLQNVGTNSMTFRVLYKAELRGTEGIPIKLKPGKEIPAHNKHKRTGIRPEETSGIDFFSIPDVFQVRTNGNYQLIVLLQASTNLWGKSPYYFALPPATNSFAVSVTE